MDIGGNIPCKYNNTALPLGIYRFTSSPVSDQPSCWHEDLEIKLIVSGTTIVVVDSEIIKATEGEILFINPYQIHSMPAFKGNDKLYNMFTLPLDFFHRTGIQALDLRKAFMEDKLRICNLIRSPKLTEILKGILDAENSDSKYRQQRILGLFLEFFSILFEEETTEGSGADPIPEMMKNYYLIEPALKHIHANFNQKNNSEQLAKLCKISFSYFCRVFKQVMGMTATDYQNEYRMQIADILLKSNKQSVTEIANIVGFEDRAYFCRCYKHYKGVSPRQTKKAGQTR